MLTPSFVRRSVIIAAPLLFAWAALPGCSATVVAFGECTVDGQAYEVGDTFSDGCNTCTCESGGAVSCTELDCGSGCVVDGVFREVGETFVAVDGCNTCTCDAPESVSCTALECSCPGTPPDCPVEPGCTAQPYCDGVSWQCSLECEECNDEPPPCPAPPDGCFYEGPYCVNGEWTCGELICDEPCGGPPPSCPQPGDPNCWSEPVCTDFGWSCETYCNGDACYDLYPEGYQTAVFQIFQYCGCLDNSTCQAECAGTQVCDGMGPTFQCEECVGIAAEQGEQCVYDAVFGDECQSDPECAAFMECVQNGG
jgi:hypothetical protein